MMKPFRLDRGIGICIFVLLFLFFIGSVGAVSKLVVLERQHYSESSGFILTTFIPPAPLNISIWEHSSNTSAFNLKTILNPPNVSSAPLSVSMADHSFNSSVFGVQTIYKIVKLHTSMENYSTVTQSLTLKTISNPPNVTSTPLSMSSQGHSLNSSSFVLSTVRNITRLSVIQQKHAFNSSFFFAAIPEPEEKANITPLSLTIEYHSLNSSSTVLTVKPTEVTIADLVVAGISWIPKIPDDGDPVTFISAVRNNGSGSTVRNFYVSFYVDGIFLGSSNPNALDPNRTVDVTQGWTASPGNHTIKVIADYSPVRGSFINESNESNNEGNKSFTVGQSDLTPIRLGWSPPSPLDGSLVNFTATVKNTGSNTSRTFLTMLYLNGTPLGDKSIAGLLSNESVNVTFGWVAVPGSYSIMLRVDSSNAVNESSESNNAITENLSHIPYPDLSISRFSWSPPIPSEGELVTFNLTVGNNGADTLRGFYTSFYIDGSKIDEEHIAGLQANASLDLTATWTATSGNHSIKVWVDSLNEIPESDEFNNERTEPLYRVKRPDLVVADLSWSPMSFSDGASVTFKSTVANTGDGDTSGSFILSFYVDGDKIGDKTVADLPVNASLNLTQTWTASPGNHTIKVRVDLSNQIPESDESNNERISSLVVGYPDLVVTALSWSPPVYAYRDAIDMEASIKNVGDGSVRSFRVGFYVNDKLIGYQNINGLGGNESLNISGPWTVSVCDALFEVRVDSQNTVLESDESNNNRNISLPPVECPDLTVTDIALSPAVPCGNQPTLIVASIHNNDVGSISQGFLVSFFVDGIYIGYGTVNGISLGESINVAAPWTAVEGVHNVSAIVDWYVDGTSTYTNIIPESNESNNERVEQFTVNPALNILSINPVSIQSICNFNSTESAYFDVVDEYGNLIPADRVFAEVLRPDAVVDLINLTGAGAGHYRLSYTDTGMLGLYNFTVHAVKENYNGSSIESGFTVEDLIPPAVSILSPGRGDVLQGNISIIIYASDSLSGIYSVKAGFDSYDFMPCSLNGSFWVCTWDTSPFSHGLHTIHARAVDGKGNVGTSSVVVDVFREFTDFIVNPGSYGIRLHPGESLSQLFTIENTGTVDIREINVSMDMNWTLINSSSIKPIAVGESATFLLTVEVPDFPDLPSWCARGCIINSYLTVNADNLIKYVSLRLDVTLPDISFAVEPSSWNLGTVPPSFTTERSFTVRNNWTNPLSVDVVIPPGSYLSLNTPPAEILYPGEETNFSVGIRIPDNVPPSSFRGSFIVLVNDSLLQNHQTVQVSGDIVIPLEVSPSSWRAGFMNPNSSLSREFIIMNTLADVRNVSLRAEGDLSEYILFDTHPLLGDLGVGESTTFTASLRIPENASDGFYRGKIVVSTERSGSVSIPVVVDVTHNRYGFVNFNVTDNQTGEPIRNALVSLSGDNDDYVAETDDEGKAGMVVWSGRYNYLSSASDYLSKSGNVDIPPGDPDVSISLARKPIIRVTVQILDEYGEFLPIDQSTGLPVIQSQRTYHFRMTIIVNTGQAINEDNIYVPPEFMPSTSSGEPASYTISREGDTYYVDWQVSTGDDFTWPLNDNIVVAAPSYAQAASPAPGRIPLEIEGDMHFGGEKFMVRAIIENLKEDPNDPYALPADAIGVKATLVRPSGISLIPGQNDTFYVGDILIGEGKNVSWLVKATETGIHNICVNVTDIYSHEWEGCAEVKAIEPATVNIKYCVPPSVQAGVSFVLDAEVFNPTELTAKDFSITFTSFNQYIKLAAGESPDRYLGDIAPNESILVSWMVVPAVSGTVEDVFFETFYEKGPVLTYEIGGVCGGIPANLSYLHLIPPVIYTTDGSGDYERVFTPYNDVNIVVVVKNPLNSPASGRMIIYVEDNETGEQVGDLISDSVVYLEPYSYSTSKVKWNTKDYSSVNRSGFTFVGKRFNVVVKLDRAYRYGFYVDEHGVPKWLRDNVEFSYGDLFRDTIERAARTNNKSYLVDNYRVMMEEVSSVGFTSVLFHHYYNYGWYASHEPRGLGSIGLISPAGVNHWFPAGPNGDEHYSTPYWAFTRLAGNSEEGARDIIRELVEISHNRGLKVLPYIDPMAMYDPEPEIYAIDVVNELLTGYPAAKAQHNSTSLGYVAMDITGSPKRANFLESVWLISDVNKLAFEVSACGPGKNGLLANNDNAFSPSVISNDHSNWEEDPSHHYHITRQVSWLINNYGFDGIQFDDTGRVIMASGPADYADEFWSHLMRPEKPTKTLYNTSEDPYCESLRGNQDRDYFAMDAFANMIKHLRAQVKDESRDNIFVSNDYFIPSDVDWKSIVAVEDESASDQFVVIKPSFARWTYLTYNEGFKVLRNDFRRSTTPVSISPVADSMRPDLVRGVLLATVWANKVHSEIAREEFEKTNETKRLLTHYIKMRDITNSLPIYGNETGQELLYHSHLKDPKGFNSDSEVKRCQDPSIISQKECNTIPPYTVLYRLPSEYGEKARILHVINSRVVSDLPYNGEGPLGVIRDYHFKVKIPIGEEVSEVYLVSADIHKCITGNITDPDRDCIEDPNYVSDVTPKSNLWHQENDYVFIKVPKVITSTVVYVGFKPALQKPLSTTIRSDRFSLLESLKQELLRPVKQFESIVEDILVNPEDDLLGISLKWPGSDLDLHLYSPSGEHIGFNYTTSSTDLIENSTYTPGDLMGRITIQDPDPGNWSIVIYGRNVSDNETGEYYTVEIALEGDYSPNVTLETMPVELELNKTLELPVFVQNVGGAEAYNISACLYSNALNEPVNLTLGDLLAGEGIYSEFTITPTVEGDVAIYVNITYQDGEGNTYELSNYSIVEVKKKPSLYATQAHSPYFAITDKDALSFNVSLANTGTDSAYNINVTVDTDMSSETLNFNLPALPAGGSAGFSFSLTPLAGKRYCKVYVSYEDFYGNGYLTAANDVEVTVEEATPYMDLDWDFVDEYAVDSDNDGIYDTYVDPNNNTGVLYKRDFNSDGKPDFLIDINNDSIAEMFYDPNNGFMSGVLRVRFYGNETQLLMAVDKDYFLDVYFDHIENITTRLKLYNATTYYIDKEGDGLSDLLYDLVGGVICYKGDFNCDGVVDNSDYLKFESIYETECSDSRYNHLADFDDNCRIDFIDFVRFARIYTG